MSEVSEAIRKKKKGEVSTEEREDYTNHELEIEIGEKEYR